MRFAIVLLVIFIAALAPAELTTTTDGHAPGSAMGYEWQPVKEIVVKWTQLPDFAQTALSAEFMTDFDYWMECADDFYCDDGSPIVALEWWGVNWTVDEIDSFIVRFYTDVPGPPFSHPGNLVYEETITSFVSEYLVDHDAYHYTADLPVSFDQAAGNIYWVSIQAVHPYTGQWYWSRCLAAYYWNDEATVRSDYHGFPEWTTVTGVVLEYGEMAFVLYADVLSPVEDASWGSIKALYR